MKNYTIEIHFCDNDEIEFDIELENEEMVKEFIAKFLEKKYFLNSDMNICIATDKIKYISWY